MIVRRRNCASASGTDIALPARDPFLAIPRVADNVEAREDSSGCLQLRKSLAPRPGIGARIARRLGIHRHIRVNLDELGTLYWRQIDGRRSLREIEACIGEAASLDKAESERATLVFTKMLMLRYLIELQIADEL